jgi:Icc-related predicted phosphoesterase
LNCIFVSDLHGYIKKYEKLFEIIRKEHPDAVFFGGDLLPNDFSIKKDMDEFLETNLFSKIKNVNQKNNIRFFVIMGNDDPRIFEKYFIDADEKGLIEYVNEKTAKLQNLFVTGYSYVPPTPFQLKDWEKYDVSRFVDVGTISPEQGKRTIKIETDEIRFSTISEDLEKLVENSPPKKTIYLFHSPPYKSALDRADLDGKKVDHAPVDVHVGSIAIKRFIEKYNPFLTLHGHIHESSSITGKWSEKKNKTYSFSAAYEKSKLAIVRFNTDNLDAATRQIIDI